MKIKYLLFSFALANMVLMGLSSNADDAGTFDVTGGDAARQDQAFNFSDDISDPNSSIGNFDRAITVREIEVLGNRMVPTKVILENMRTKKGSKFSRRKIAYDLKTLDSMGYFNKDKLMAIPVPQGEEGIVLKIQVVENSPITGVIVTGNTDIDKTKIESFLTPLIGMPRSTIQIKSAVERIEAFYHDKGYMLASITELHFDPDGYLTVSIDEGKIGAVAFVGNDRTQEDYLMRILPDTLKEGAPYNEANVAQFLEGMKRTGFFKEISREIVTDPNNPEMHTLTFKLEEQRTKALNVGGGLGTLNGLFGNIGFTEPNFRGQGENLSLNAYAGTGLVAAIDGDTDGRFARRGDFRLNFAYADPFVGDSDISAGFNVNVQQAGSFIVDSALQRTIGAGMSFAKPIELFGNKNWNFQMGLAGSSNEITRFGSGARQTLINGLRAEGNSDSESARIADRLREEQTRDGYYFDLTPSLVYRKYDDQGTGWRHTLFGGPALGFGGVGSYGTLGVDSRRYVRLTEDGWFFKNASHAETQLGDPASFRNLKAAGPYGMRGYRQFRDVGIGSTMLSNSAEFSIPFTIPKVPFKDTKFVIFNDLGLVAGENRFNDLYNRESLLASFGFGLEINVPFVGPLRLDYGIPLIRTDNKSFFSGRFTINAGNQL